MFIAFDFPPFQFLPSIFAVLVCESINPMRLSPWQRWVVRCAHVFILGYYTVKLSGLHLVGRTYLFKVNINIYLFAKLVKSNRYLYLYGDAAIVCIQLLGIAIVSRRSVVRVCDFERQTKATLFCFVWVWQRQ